MSTAAESRSPAGDGVLPDRAFQVLHQLAVASAGVLNPEAVAGAAIEATCELLGVDTSGLFWWDPATDELYALAASKPLFGSAYFASAPGAVGTAFRMRGQVLVDDYPRWEFAEARGVERGVKSVAAVPLIVRDRAVGVLTVRAYAPRAWTAQDARLLDLLAAQVGPSLEAARLHTESERRRAEAEALAEIVRVGATERDPERIMAFICEQAARLLGADYDGIALAKSDRQRTWSAMWGNRSDDWRRETRGRGTGSTGRCMRERRTIIRDVSDDPSSDPHTHVSEGGKTVLSTPLIIRDTVLGALTLGWRTPMTPTADQARLAETLARYAATVLDNARSYAEEQAERSRAEAVAETLLEREQALQELHAQSERRRSEAEALADLARQGASAHDLGPAVDLICQRARQLVGADFAAVLARTSLGDLEWMGASGNESNIWQKSHSTTGAGPAGKSMLEGLTILATNSEQESPLRELRMLGAERAETALAVPLIRHDGSFGSVIMAWRTRTEVTPAQLRLAEALGGFAAAVLDNALSHVESERRREEAEALAELARHGAMEHDTDRIITLICEQAKHLSGADYAALRLLDQEGHLTWGGMIGNVTNTWRDRGGRSIQGHGSGHTAINKRETVVSHTRELAARGVLDPESVRAKEGGAVELATPLIYRGAARGALVLGWRTEIDPSAEQTRLAEAVASYASVILENARAHEALAQQALYDELTELPNRRLFQDRLEQAMLAAQRGGHPIALLLMDLDRFKEVNDTLGHQTGDLLLRDIAGRLRSALRNSDTVARLGGDEFAVVLASMEDSGGAAVAANKLLSALTEPMLLKGHSIHIAGSIGIALCPEHGRDAETLLRHADVAMYVAKRTGGGSAIYAPEMDRDHADRLSLTQDLRLALERNELTLEYQPRVNLATGLTEGVEALVRWQHPKQGLILPAHFIPLAEQTGLIRRVSRWVLKAVFEQHRAWRNAGLDLHVAVNLSMRDLHDPQLPNVITELAQAYHEQPDWLIVEITEGAVMSEPEMAQRALAKLHALGIRVAIDDFGTGYSSLSYLNRLSIDEIKVDRSFVDRMASNQKNYAIVRATIEMGHALGAAVIAEGVEEQADLDVLNQLSCDGAQGFLLCTPAAPEELVRWLAAPRL